MDAGPFFVAAASQVFGVAIQRIVDIVAKGDYDRLSNDGSKNKYNPPPFLGREELSKRWGRDSDVLLAALFAGTMVAFALEDLERHPSVRYVVGGVGVLLPVVAMAVMLSVHPDRYGKYTLFKDHFPITPFAYIAATLALLLGLAVTWLG